MSSRNLAIVWAPNLLRTAMPVSSPSDDSENNNKENKSEVIPENDNAGDPEDKSGHAKLQLDLVQNTQVVQYLIDNAKWLFSEG